MKYNVSYKIVLQKGTFNIVPPRTKFITFRNSQRITFILFFVRYNETKKFLNWLWKSFYYIMNHTSYEILLPFVLRQIILCCRSRFVFDQTIIKMNESFVIDEILRFLVVWSHSANNVQRGSSDTVQVTLQPFVSLPRRMTLSPSRQLTSTMCRGARK